MEKSNRYNSLDNCLAKPFLDDSSILSHRQDDRERQTFMSRFQAAQLLAERRWQHGDNTLDKVNTCGAFASITVQGGVGFDEV